MLLSSCQSGSSWAVPDGTLSHRCSGVRVLSGPKVRNPEVRHKVVAWVWEPSVLPNLTELLKVWKVKISWKFIEVIQNAPTGLVSPFWDEGRQLSSYQNDFSGHWLWPSEMSYIFSTFCVVLKSCSKLGVECWPRHWSPVQFTRYHVGKAGASPWDLYSRVSNITWGRCLLLCQAQCSGYWCISEKNPYH